MKMYKISGLEQFGCPIELIVLAVSIPEVLDKIENKYDTKTRNLAEEVINKHGIETSSDIFEVGVG